MIRSTRLPLSTRLSLRALGSMAPALAAMTLLASGGAQAQDKAAAAPEAEPVKDAMSQPRDWSATLIQDATALHDTMIDSHPGVYDTLNPQFRARLDDGLATALERAKTTTTAGGWWWALRSYVAAFEDGHVQIGITQPNYGFPTRWPGFLTVYRGADQVVADRDAIDASAPPLGARLIDCDGVSGDALAEQRVGQFRGRWFLESQHVYYGDWTFLDAQNPWITDMRQCRFEADGKTQAYPLTWRAAPDDLAARRQKLTQVVRPEFGLKETADGGFWISTPSFNGNPGGAVHTALTALVADMAGKQDALRAAPYVVLDLRGNGGGSSHWSVEMALILWGRDWLVAHPMQQSEAVDWRASEANQAQIAGFLEKLKATNGQAGLINWAERAANGMARARAAGEIYWREGDETPGTPASADAKPKTVAPPADTPLLLKGPVYVLTDSGCGSACLDAVDFWKAAGAIQFGRETSADTVYMEVRSGELPSGLAEIAVPMKVYRGRGRGNNEPQRPAYIYAGDMGDEAGLLRAIQTIQPR